MSLQNGTQHGVYQSVSVSVYPSTLSNMNTSKTSWPIKIKFHRELYWGGGLAALGLVLDQIGTLVSMATDSSHRVIRAKIL